jgi:arylsulfatase A-like enzyme
MNSKERVRCAIERKQPDRVPFIVRWPGVVAPESRCDQLVCQSDLLATCAEMFGSALPDDAGEDSVSMMPLLRGGRIPVRDHIVHHSFEGKFAVRKGRWKLLLCPGSGGWTYRDAEAAAAGLPSVQLYDLQEDPAEQNNLQAEHPEKVRDLLTLLEKMVAEGRSTPGPLRTNDVPVDLWKTPKAPDLTKGL